MSNVKVVRKLLAENERVVIELSKLKALKRSLRFKTNVLTDELKTENPQN